MIRLPGESDLEIASLETFRLHLPYKKPISFKSVHETRGEFVIISCSLSTTELGRPCRGSMSTDRMKVRMRRRSRTCVLANIRRQIEQTSIPSAQPLIEQRLNEVSGCRAAKSLLDIALWDIRGKILGQPVWRLLGAASPRPVPLTWIAHGDTSEAMIDEAATRAQDGFFGIKLKTWRRSEEDVLMVQDAVRGDP